MQSSKLETIKLRQTSGDDQRVSASKRSQGVNKKILFGGCGKTFFTLSRVNWCVFFDHGRVRVVATATLVVMLGRRGLSLDLLLFLVARSFNGLRITIIAKCLVPYEMLVSKLFNY